MQWFVEILQDKLGDGRLWSDFEISKVESLYALESCWFCKCIIIFQLFKYTLSEKVKNQSLSEK